MEERALLGGLREGGAALSLLLASPSPSTKFLFFLTASSPRSSTFCALLFPISMASVAAKRAGSSEPFPAVLEFYDEALPVDRRDTSSLSARRGQERRVYTMNGRSCEFEHERHSQNRGGTDQGVWENELSISNDVMTAGLGISLDLHPNDLSFPDRCDKRRSNERIALLLRHPLFRFLGKVDLRLNCTNPSIAMAVMVDRN